MSLSCSFASEAEDGKNKFVNLSISVCGFCFIVSFDWPLRLMVSGLDYYTGGREFDCHTSSA